MDALGHTTKATDVSSPGETITSEDSKGDEINECATDRKDLGLKNKKVYS